MRLASGTLPRLLSATSAIVLSGFKGGIQSFNQEMGGMSGIQCLLHKIGLKMWKGMVFTLFGFKGLN